MTNGVGLTRFGQAPETIASAGSGISDAADLTGPISVVTGTSGAQLPDLAVGETILVHSASGAFSLYPHSATGTINGGSAGAAVTVAANELAIASRFSSTDWRVKVAVNP